ncbi:tetratricopeptide repeat protein [Brevibacillus daliensis]|uniref:tetratricopeptide repeat protein n=1 Tax=Brevibacillus daliensis TaxID=2892995 RepID=UPI001E3C8747|nr:tetratricopeptide repeat protein [Brevibacillus daliensis]
MHNQGIGKKDLDLVEAVEWFNKAIKQDMIYSDAYYGLAVTYGELERYEEAIEIGKKYVDMVMISSRECCACQDVLPMCRE